MISREQRKIKLILFGPADQEFTDGWNLEDVPPSLRDNVILPGFLKRMDLPAYYSGLDFYISLSRAEGGPYPVMECMACQVVVISTPVGVVPDLIEDNVNGFLVDEDNYLKRIPEIIDRCTEDPAFTKSVRATARVSAVSKHAWENVSSAEDS